MRKIAIALAKGGVGKTTTAVNLAHGLSRAGQAVLLVDLDTQGQAGDALGIQPEIGLAELILGEASLSQSIVEARPGLHLLAGGRALAGIKRLQAKMDFGGEKLIAKALAPLESQYQYALLDFAPSWDGVSIAALFYAQEILAPISLEPLAIKGLASFMQRIEDIQEHHAGLSLRYILPTFLDRRVRKSQEILEQLQGYAGEMLCQPIRYNVKLSEAPAHGLTIFEYAPHSSGAEDYQALTERILQDAKRQDS